LPNGPQLTSQFHVKPIGAERSRSFDFGIDEIAWNGRAKLGLTLFQKEFREQIEFVDASVLPQLGVTLNVADVTHLVACVNSGALLNVNIMTRITLSFIEILVWRRDDSTHLTDAFFGNTLLLPNRNLDAAYHKIDPNGNLRVNSAVELYSSLENVLNQHYDAA